MAHTDALGEALRPFINELVEGKLAELKLEETVKEAVMKVAKGATKTLEIRKPEGGEPIKLGVVHKQFELLLKVVSSGENVLVMGGAGRGKTTAIVNIAKALDLGFRVIPFSSMTTKTDLVGFTDAMGVYRKSPLIEAMENGDIILFDEFDAANPAALMVINGLVENRFVDTPNGVVYAHENFRVVASANTNLRGSTKGYSARAKLDDATIDRFSVLEWELDEELEKLAAGNNSWVEIIQNVRKRVESELDGIEITPRASIKGARLLKAGVPFDTTVKMVLHKGMDKDTCAVMDKEIAKHPSLKKECVKGTPSEGKVEMEVEAKKDDKKAKEVEAELADPSGGEYEW